MGKVAALVGTLAHANPLVRGVLAGIVGLVFLQGAWAAGYLWLPEHAVSAVSLARHAPLDLLAEPGSLGLTIFGWNAVFGGGTILLASLFSVGRLPLGLLAPWAWFGAYGLLLGTNSFAFPSPFGKMAPQLALGWEHIGLRELSGYLLFGVALANAHLWRYDLGGEGPGRLRTRPSRRTSEERSDYRSWRGWRLVRVRGWREVRLSLPEAGCLALGVLLLAWSAFAEAVQIAEVVR